MGFPTDKEKHFPTETRFCLQKNCTFLQKNEDRGAHSRKLQEIAGGFHGSRIKNASQLSQECARCNCHNAWRMKRSNRRRTWRRSRKGDKNKMKTKRHVKHQHQGPVPPQRMEIVLKDEFQRRSILNSLRLCGELGCRGADLSWTEGTAQCLSHDRRLHTLVCEAAVKASRVQHSYQLGRLLWIGSRSTSAAD